MKKTHNYLKNYTIILLYIVISNIFYSNNKVLSNNYLMEKEHLILDLQNNIVWLRCSVGQIWKNNTCEGTPIKLTMEQVEQAKKKAKEQLEGDWRLPTRKELESIVCFECSKVKLILNFSLTRLMNHFGLGKEHLVQKFFWSVNFFTGHTFGRFPGTIPNFVRLVRNR